MPKSKSITTPMITLMNEATVDYYAAYRTDKENNIEPKITRVICWTVIRYPKEPDEVVAQIWDGDCIREANEVENFGEFVGVYRSIEEASEAIKEADEKARVKEDQAQSEYEDDEEEYEDEEEEEDDEYDEDEEEEYEDEEE